ncbi:cutinase family protein [Candidatus Saccharibacteria bacterium]|nr:cutinase family protein [Candidatus Saccharibacteria bacterium]
MKRLLWYVSAVILGIYIIYGGETRAQTSCKDLRIVFARGSGAPRENNADYQAFKNSIENLISDSGISYEFIDLDYPAIGVGFDNLNVVIGAVISGGEGNEFGESVKAGATNLARMVNDECTDTKYVLGGYSQGAMVIIKALKEIRPERIIYAATFGDPKIYLPEGEGIIPAACRGENLSPYRMYVPDCMAYKGLLGAYIPYVADEYLNKVGTWCNKRDIFCSSRFSINDHVSYENTGLYEDAAKVIYLKIADVFGIDKRVVSPHDTVFLIDATWSMEELIDKYKSEAARLAKETLDSGGRVALFAYHDLDDFVDSLVEYCDFESCNSIETFESKLGEIVTEYGGDLPESLLSASFNLMKSLNWKLGSTKSLVVLTDAGYHAPDRDGTTFDAVVKLSKEIDPVNFYVITNEEVADEYVDLTSATGGKIETDFGKLNLLTDYIMERSDALPRVEEIPEEVPALEILSESYYADTATVNYSTDGEKVIVIINGQIVGTATEKEIIVTNLDRRIDNEIILAPVSGEVRGEASRIVVPADGLGGTKNDLMVVIPKAPSTGGH